MNFFYNANAPYVIPRPQTVVAGASLIKEKDGNLKWDMPRPVRYDPHWISPVKRREAEAKGLDKMTAGVGYVIMVPIYKGMAKSVAKTLHNASKYNFKKTMRRVTKQIQPSLDKLAEDD